MTKKQALSDKEIQQRLKNLKCNDYMLIGTKGFCIDNMEDALIVASEDTFARISYLDALYNVWDIARHFIGEITDVKPCCRLVWVDGKISPVDV